MTGSLDILYEDNHLLAVNKPAGVLSAHFDGTTETLDRTVEAYLRAKYQKPGNVFLGIVHRLDKPTSGVLVFARTSKGAARLSEQFRDGMVEKTYWAVVDGAPAPPAGTFDDWLCKNQATGRVEVLPAESPGAKPARTHYETRSTSRGWSWLELRPQTGRTHQLRVQLASRRWPVIGDFAYGSETPFPEGIALHARSLTFLHPTRREPIVLTAELPRTWRGRFAHLLAGHPA